MSDEDSLIIQQAKAFVEKANEQLPRLGQMRLTEGHYQLMADFAEQREAKLITALEHYAKGTCWNGAGGILAPLGQFGDSLYTFGGSHQNGYDIARQALDKTAAPAGDGGGE